MSKIRSTRQPAMPAAHQVAPEVDAILANWGRWAAPGRGSSGGSSSLWRFAARGDRSAVYYGAPVVVPVDTAQAASVERTVCSTAFSGLMRAILRAHYVQQWHPLRTSREVGLHLAAYDEWVWRASVYFAQRHTTAGGGMTKRAAQV